MAYITYFSIFDLWQYHKISDDKLCDICEELAAEGTYNGNALRSRFPDLTIQDHDTIAVNRHPWCRCQLVRISNPEDPRG